jgi:hypothetical protein
MFRRRNPRELIPIPLFFRQTIPVAHLYYAET